MMLCRLTLGPCLSSSECETGGSYYICANECVDRSHFPLDMYPTLAQIYGYQSGDIDEIEKNVHPIYIYFRRLLLS